MVIRGDAARRFANTRLAVALAVVLVLYLTAQALDMHWAWRLVLHLSAVALLLLTAVEQLAGHRLAVRAGQPAVQVARPMAPSRPHQTPPVPSTGGGNAETGQERDDEATRPRTEAADG